jgi:hypothetical protein
VEHRFETLDKPIPCTKCGKQTTVMVTGRLCSVCAGVWSPAQRAGILDTLRNPLKRVEKKTGGKSREDLFKAAPKSKQDEDPQY